MTDAPFEFVNPLAVRLEGLHVDLDPKPVALGDLLSTHMILNLTKFVEEHAQKEVDQALSAVRTDIVNWHAPVHEESGMSSGEKFSKHTALDIIALHTTAKPGS